MYVINFNYILPFQWIISIWVPSCHSPCVFHLLRAHYFPLGGNSSRTLLSASGIEIHQRFSSQSNLFRVDIHVQKLTSGRDLNSNLLCWGDLFQLSYLSTLVIQLLSHKYTTYICNSRQAVRLNIHYVLYPLVLFSGTKRFWNNKLSVSFCLRKADKKD